MEGVIMAEFKSTHNLEFGDGGKWSFDPSFSRFKIGTVTGIWRAKEKCYEILGVTNDTPGNGHFTDVLEWFEHSCRRDKYAFVFLEVWNERLYKHLVEKQQFSPVPTTKHLIKWF
jgi:hypothetical protein